MFFELQVLPAVSHICSPLLHIRVTYITAVFHQLLDGGHSFDIHSAW